MNQAGTPSENSKSFDHPILNPKNDSSTYIHAPFILADSPARISTMRQYSQNYHSATLVALNFAHKNLKPIPYLLLSASITILTIPLTHEEGHRSVLTYKNIGSISRPYFNSRGAAYVQGVTDASLIDLRDSDLPNYIRLHTAGLESDYMLALRSERSMVFNKNISRLLFFEYYMRRYALFSYYLTGLLEDNPAITPETDELERDIVGHDVYGAVRHIHRPDMDFYRYTRFEDLTDEEVRMVKRIGRRSFLNLAAPILFKDGFTLTPAVRCNFSLGYTMSPFGDFMDQNIWLQVHGQLIGAYARQYQNKQTWFPAGGMGVYRMPIGKRVNFDAEIHLWEQPKNLSFTTTKGEFGGAADCMLRYIFTKNIGELQGISVDVGVTLKTQGFLPEEMNMGRGLWGRFGMSVYY